MKIYLGYSNGGARMKIFRFERDPTEADGLPYAAVVGPFRTMRGARFMRDHGQNNPHCRCVAEAEALGKRHERESRT